ncbi:HAMP domain-containing histidine kinase [bacterium BMS3Abin03]|nr:HAMP domain-containing histidine kinase [bacterium BMS3Abin03]
MNRFSRKIWILLLVIILLPVIVLILNELNNLSDNEEVLENIYSNQLDAILFSVNQYSQDVVGSWANQIDISKEVLNSDEFLENRKAVDSFFTEFPSLNMIVFADSIKDKNLRFVFSAGANRNVDSLNLFFQNVLNKNDMGINRLFTYKRGGYRKIEPVVNDSLSILSFLLFVDDTKDRNGITIIAIDPHTFIQRILSPKIQEVASEDFVISIFNRSESYQYNSKKDFFERKVQKEKELWIFPNYDIGISLNGETIDELVKRRAVTNIVIISVLSLVLILGIWLILRNARKEVQLAQAKSDFVSNVSHELRTPLSLISMFAETLEMNRVSSEEKKKEYYSIISQEANRLGRIVNNILNFSRMEEGRRKFNLENKNVNELVERIYNNYNFHLKNKGFNFEYNLADNLPAIRMDEEAISEALINLIDNAVKYSNEKKEVHIRTGKEGNYVFIEVKDEGIGIATEEQKKIFNKFYRVSTGLVHNTKGTGLGLTLVKYIMDAHNAEIKIDSKIGGGSNIKLLFPAE